MSHFTFVEIHLNMLRRGMKTYSIPNTNYSLGHAVKSHRRSFYQFNLLDMASENYEKCEIQRPLFFTYKECNPSINIVNSQDDSRIKK